MSQSSTRKNPRRVSCDADVLRTFWEKKIELHTKRLRAEDLRVLRSALDRLRSEWARKLERRNQMLQSGREAAPRPAPPTAPGLQTQDQSAA